MSQSRTIHRQNAVKSIAQIFQGHGELSEDEEQQFKRLIRETAEFNKRGTFQVEGDNPE